MASRARAQLVVLRILVCATSQRGVEGGSLRGRTHRPPARTRCRGGIRRGLEKVEPQVEVQSTAPEVLHVRE
eukprot:1016087-Alexandrium_andersonii.AAC.1